MMFWLLFLFTTSAFAQIDTSAIRELDDQLPDYSQTYETPEEKEFTALDRKFNPPKKIVSMEEIIKSGTQKGAVSPGYPMVNLSTNKNETITKLIYVNYFNLEDENGFKYIKNKDGSVQWRIKSDYVEPMKQELVLYEPPHRYTPAPDNIVRTEYDKKLSIPPEVSFYVGTVQGSYMSDLFDDEKAKSGISNQYGIHFFTQWKLPIKAGAVIHYEKSSYDLAGGGQVIYSAPSFGPQFKTRDFELFGHPLRFQTQFRVSPFAKATAETVNGPITFKFNSADLLASIERPIKNRFGEFVLGLYMQNQWLNMKEQPKFVNVRATNETNKSFGLSFAQVFE
jgi:hypothetical protein